MKKPTPKTFPAAKMKGFEKSKADVDPKGMKEGSPADKALDKKQMPPWMKGKGKPKGKR